MVYNPYIAPEQTKKDTRRLKSILTQEKFPDKYPHLSQLTNKYPVYQKRERWSVPTKSKPDVSISHLVRLGIPT